MDKERLNLRAALKFLCSEQEEVCRLCLSSTGNSEVRFDSKIPLKRSYYNGIMTVRDMLIELELPEEPDLPEILCKECSVTVTNAYLFKKLCEYSTIKWNNVMESLENNIIDIENVSPSAKTVFLVLNKDEKVMFTSRAKTNTTTKEESLKKLKYLSKYRDNYANTKKSRQIMKKEMKGTKGNVCKHCGKRFLSKQQVLAHIERIHDPKIHNCPDCDKKFSTKKILRLHIDTHHVPVVCKLCLEEFPSKYKLRSHLDKHDTHKCPTCQKTYANRTTFKGHLKICSKTEKVPAFFCNECGKGYLGKNGLRSHLKTDHGFGSLLSCSWCDKKFDAISRLKMHIVKHTRERNFPCEQCGGKFVTRAALIYHQRLHTGERPFPCDLCNESFLSASRRMEHKYRAHFGPSKECHICHVKFVMGHQLKKHIQRHFNPQSKLYIEGMIVEPVNS